MIQHDPVNLSDKEAEELLRLMHKAVTEYDSCANMSISEFASDLAMAMDETTDKADQYRREIEEFVT
jgi:hypothetical protein